MGWWRFSSTESDYWSLPWRVSSLTKLNTKLNKEKPLELSDLKVGEFYLFYKVNTIYSSDKNGKTYSKRQVLKSIARVEFIGNPIGKKNVATDLLRNMKLYPLKFQGKEILYTNAGTNSYYTSEFDAKVLYCKEYGDKVFAFPYERVPTKEQRKLMDELRRLEKEQEELQSRVYKLHDACDQLLKEYEELDEEKWKSI
jgi:hypothetical protein